MRILWAACVFITLAFGCGTGSDSDQKATSRRHAVYPATAWDPDARPVDPEAARKHGETFDWQERGPLEFLEFLRAAYRGPREVAGDPPFGGYTVWGVHRGWVRESDIPALLALLDSREPCLAVESSLSSFRTNGTSTVGREAAFLIEGFRAEEERSGYAGYPPALSSNRDSSPTATALRAWWSSRRGG